MYCDPTVAGACSSNEPHLQTQGNLNDIVHNFNLSKKQAELLGSRLKGQNLMSKDTKAGRKISGRQVAIGDQIF
jgi:hypothetical protein